MMIDQRRRQKAHYNFVGDVKMLNVAVVKNKIK